MRPFIPYELPIKNLNWTELVPLLGKANRELAKFDSLLSNTPEPDILLSPLTTNEAVVSSKIEGTQATLEDIYRFEVSPDKETSRYDDIQEIINYRRAITEASEKLDTLPLGSRLIKGIHQTLLSGVRGQNKTPGIFRNGQVYIGRVKDIENAVFVPPEHQTIPDHFSNLEKYIHFDEKDILVQLAIVHAQFEIIHPFWDGNGRTGRIIMPLFLYYKKIISSPNFYLSEYFEKDRDAYNSSLNSISKTGRWENWIDYFLNAVIVQSAINSKKVESILTLHGDMLDKVQNMTRSQYTHKIVEFIFSKPFFTTTMFIEELKVSRNVATRILQPLSENNILEIKEIGKGSRSSRYIFLKLLEIVK